MRKNPHTDGQVNWIDEMFVKYDPKPKGWVTVKDVCKQSGHPESTVSHRLKSMSDDGFLECKVFLVNRRPTKCYRKK